MPSLVFLAKGRQPATGMAVDLMMERNMLRRGFVDERTT
jgi:hypothetical protein